MFKTILVPTDGSDHAEKAVLLAADIAEKYAARLIFLHVLPQGPMPEALRRMADVEHVTTGPAPGPIADIPRARIPAGFVNYKEDPAREVYEVVGRQLLRRAEQLAKEKGATAIECVVADGDPAQQVLDHADKQDANLIVMGSRGLGDLKGLLMGSVSHKVSHLARCTCVTVK
jgi:nucleotide-binding universal stress UspA family protein